MLSDFSISLAECEPDPGYRICFEKPIEIVLRLVMDHTAHKNARDKLPGRFLI